MKSIGLTGSIAMGKSTAAQMFRDFGIPVHDSDYTVHKFYRDEAAELLAPHFPDAIVNNCVERSRLSGYVLNNTTNMKLLESIVHPYVEKDRLSFIEKQSRSGQPVVVLDIPLLFEIGGQTMVDIIAVVSATEQTQRKRALARPNMTREKFESIKAKQLPDDQKRKQAHVVISTEQALDNMRHQIASLLTAIA